MSKVVPLAIAAWVAATVLAAPGAAQDWRTVSSQRKPAGEEQVRVHVRFAAGKLNIEPAAAGTLYRSTMRYDARSFEPVNEYSDGRLQLGTRGVQGQSETNIREGGRLDLALGPDVPLELELEFGAVEAEIELGGLRIRRTELSTGASDTRVRFSQPNPERMRRLTLKAGAVALRVAGLANANVEAVEVSGGVGDLTLDFTGDWRGDMDVDVDMGLGSLTLVIPRGVGVRVAKDTFLMAFNAEGMIKRRDAYYSPDWDSATHRLTVTIDGAFGSIDVRWVDANDVL